jgi:hypothetical protein
VTRRPALAIAALIATLSLVIAACSSTPAAPALSDPKEILTASVESLKNVTTVEFVGTLTGKLNAAELGGSLDLSSTTIAGALDVPNKKAKVHIEAPSLMGTTIDALVVDGSSYVKVEGIAAGFLGMEPGKYVKSDSVAVSETEDVGKSVDEFKTMLDELPTAPTKEADEKCGDQDCYHVQLHLSAEDLAKMDPAAADIPSGDVTIDLWSQKSDLHPAKLSVSATSPETGTIGVTFTFKYGGTVDVSAPPADQVVEQ